MGEFNYANFVWLWRANKKTPPCGGVFALPSVKIVRSIPGRRANFVRLADAHRGTARFVRRDVAGITADGNRRAARGVNIDALRRIDPDG